MSDLKKAKDNLKEVKDALSEKKTFTLPKGVWYVVGLLALVGGLLFITQLTDCGCSDQTAVSVTEAQ